MASITGLSNQNYVSSLYNSSKTISGLASGLDTESMIEGLTQSYQAKITQLQQKSTKAEWKQEAYRSVISKMHSYSNKYTSYTSSTNLLSQSFWNSARTSSVSGKYADKVSASGTSTSDIELNSVTKMAASARYATSGNFVTGDANSVNGTAVDLTGSTEISALTGSITLTYGTKNVTLMFSESDIIKPEGDETNAEALARVINDKLKEETITLSDSSVAASTRIRAEAGEDGSISFVAANAGSDGNDKAGNSIYMSGASKELAEKLGLPNLDKAKDDKPAKFTMTDGTKTDGDFFKTSVDNIDKISGKSMNINLNGTVKKITMPTIQKNDDGSYSITGADGKKYENVAKEELADTFTEALGEVIGKEFGTKITVSNELSGTQDEELKGKLQLKMEVADGSDLLINTDAGDSLGIGKVASNYLSTGKSLKELGISLKDLEEVKDDDGNGTGKYKFTINGKDIGEYDENTSLSTIMSDINSKSDVKVSYSKTSRQFVFTSKDTGENSKVEIDGGLAGKLFGNASKKGQDSEFTVTVNGETKTLNRSDNKVEIDGLTINFKGKFTAGEDDEPVSFQNTVQSDKVVEQVKNMVAELNVILAETRSGYATMPAQKSSGATYDPLTDEDMSSMSETAIKNYEEKAKQGLLFADSNLSGLYNNLVSVFNRSGMDRTMMEKMGIGISYDANGAATITLEEDKLRSALESDFEGVVDIFTRSKENGGGTDGIMQAIKTQMDRYGATTGAVKGILVQQAGTPLASLSLLDNGWQKEIDNYSSQIEKWQEKLEKQVDRYTKLFTRLETLTNQMNSQSSALAGLMGG